MKKRNPKIGQFVYDPYYKIRRKVQAITCEGRLYFIGAEREPVSRDEFFFPLPTREEKRYISVDSKQY